MVHHANEPTEAAILRAWAKVVLSEPRLPVSVDQLEGTPPPPPSSGRRDSISSASSAGSAVLSVSPAAKKGKGSKSNLLRPCPFEWCEKVRVGRRGGKKKRDGKIARTCQLKHVVVWRNVLACASVSVPVPGEPLHLADGVALRRCGYNFFPSHPPVSFFQTNRGPRPHPPSSVNRPGVHVCKRAEVPYAAPSKTTETRQSQGQGQGQRHRRRRCGSCRGGCRRRSRSIRSRTNPLTTPTPTPTAAQPDLAALAPALGNGHV